MAYVYNPFTFGLDYTDRRILAPLEANIANLVIMTSANEARSLSNQTKVNKLRTANTIIWPKVFDDHESRIEALEDTDILNHAPRITALETSNTTMWSQVYDTHVPKIITQDSIIAYEQAKTQKISQAGQRGQINVLQKDADYKIRPEWIIFEGHFTANTNNEVAIITTNLAVTLQDVFNTWERFAFGPNGSGSDIAINNVNAFMFNPSPANTISCTYNTSHAVGFISDTVTDDYEIEVDLTVTTSGDNDRMGVIIAYTIEPISMTHANHYYLAALRNQETQYGWRVVAHAVYNVKTPPDTLGKYIKVDSSFSAGGHQAEVVIDRTDVIPIHNFGGQGQIWDGAGTRIKIRREGDIIRAWSSPYNSFSVVNNSEIVINLNDAALGNPSEAQLQNLTIDRGSVQWDHTRGMNDGFQDRHGRRTSWVNGPNFLIFEKFKGPRPYGFICQSQNRTTFDVVNFENYSSTRAEKFVFDLTEDKVWVPDLGTGTYKHATASNLESELGRGRIIRDKTSNDVFYFNQNAEVVPLFRPGTVDHLTVQMETLMTLMANTANQVANLYANIIHGTELK